MKQIMPIEKCSGWYQVLPTGFLTSEKKATLPRQSRQLLQKVIYGVLWASLLAFAPVLPGQTPLSLEACIERARQESIGVLQADLSIQQAILAKKQAVQSLLPTLNATINGGVQFGRTIDPTTNTFNTQNIEFNSFSLQTGLPLFAGGNRRFSIQKSHLDIEVAKYETAALEQDISMSVATAYLNILLNQEQVAAAEAAVNLAKAQLTQTEKLISAGSLPANDRLEMQAQLASARQNLVLAQNALDLSYLQLRQLLLLPIDEPLEIVRPELLIPEETDPLLFSDEAVFLAALNTQPRIRADEYRLKSAAKATQIVKARQWPALNLFAQMNTNWSSAARQISGYDTHFVPLDVRLPDGSVQTFEFSQQVPILDNTPYWDQLDQNFGQSIGLSLQIPIYNGSATRLDVQRAQLNELNTYYSTLQNKQNLQTSVQNAVANARAGRESYQASLHAFEAAKAAYENAAKRFQLGGTNVYELNATQTRMEQARADLLRAKYAYVFYLKLVDFYLGKPLKF